MNEGAPKTKRDGRVDFSCPMRERSPSSSVLLVVSLASLVGCAAPLPPPNVTTPEIVRVERPRAAALPIVTTPPAPTAAPPVSPSRAQASARADGLVIEDLHVGSGTEARRGDRVRVHYVGRFLDGREFDSTQQQGRQPFEFILGKGQVIKGWEEGLVGMRIGGRRLLTIPPSLAYGDGGAGGTIPPGSTLVFEIELLDVLP